MRPRRRRLSTVVLATAAFLAVALESPPIVPSISTARPAPPSSSELAVLDQIIEWVEGPEGSSFRAMSAEDVTAAIRSHRRSFELFRSYNEIADRQRFLLRLPYGRLISRAARRFEVDGLLVAAVVEAESGFNPGAISPVGALGLMQVMPATASSYGVSDVLDPTANVHLGTRYLSQLLDEFDGDLELALAAYNAGPGAVRRYDGVPPFRETRDYVRRVLSRYVDHHQTLWQESRGSDWLLE